MEFVGKSFKKEFKGHGIFSGIVESYDSSSGFFKIVYEDGDSEELDFKEVSSFICDDNKAEPSLAGPGRKTKRRRLEPRKQVDSGNEYEKNIVDLNDECVDNLRESGGFYGNLDKDTDLINGFVVVEHLNNNNVDADLRNGGLDLNAGFNFKLNDEIIDIDVNYEEKKKRRECIDLNLDANGGEIEEENLKMVETQRRERCCFDLNLGVDDDHETSKDDKDSESKEQLKECNNDLNVVEETKMENSVGVVMGTHSKDELANVTLVEVNVDEDYGTDFVGGLQRESIISCEDLTGGVAEPSIAVTDGCQGHTESAYKPGRGRRRRRNVLDSMGVTTGITECGVPDSDGIQLKEGILEPDSALIDGSLGDAESAHKRGRGRRKSRRVLDSMDVLTVTVCSDANIVSGKANKVHDSDGILFNEGVSRPESAVIDEYHDGVGSASMQGKGRRKCRRVSKTMDAAAIKEGGDTNIVSGDNNKVHDSDGIQSKECVSEHCSVDADGCQGDVGSEYKRRRGRRRKSVEENVNAMTEMVLRRSSRRGSVRHNDSSTTLYDASSSPSVSAGMEEKPIALGLERHEEPGILPPKLQLPPSSQNLDLEGIPVLDIFSIYACLRSFSTVLFLSPFQLEDFVAALKCKSPSTLFDCIHVSILQTLRKHLEILRNEGSESASNCLRSLNWDLLDLITWPIFMVEYLMIHGAESRPGFDLNLLQLFKSDYYKQPISVKVEILRWLCDDMIEVDAIRLELSRRSSASEADMDFDRNTNIEGCKRKRATIDVASGSCLTEENVDNSTDWNSDECCLCKMDGSLICCDGCPAAYHSKCVGLASDLLPEGHWYCPECATNRRKPWVKPRKSLRGAELLGIDPHGRAYFNSCGYLLVSDSCDTDGLFTYYHRDDLIAVIDVLKSSEFVYSGIIKGIYKQWGIPVGLHGASSHLNSLNMLCTGKLMREHNPAVSIPLSSFTSSGICPDKNHGIDERNVEEKTVSLLDSVTSMEVPCMNSEVTATESNSVHQNFEKLMGDCTNRAVELSNPSEAPEISQHLLGSSYATTSSDIKQETGDRDFANGSTSQMPCETGYLNYYSFAQTASLVVEELTSKSSDKANQDCIKTEEEIISTQMKAILKHFHKFLWPNIQSLSVDALKEKCGWCFICRGSGDDADCLFKMNMSLIKEGSKSDVVGLLSKRNKKGHLVDVICHILSIEDRLHGLLLGPWLNPHYTKIWRKSVLKAPHVMSLKHLLLELETNLHPLAISADWLKHVDSAITVGSACHVVIASSRASLKHGVGRKRARGSEFENKPSPNAAGGLSLCWWRGGRLSRQVFSWKVLPCSLASKAARLAGCSKIPGILYPESSDFAKRSKYVAWRAAVASATSIEQLAIQVRDLDSNIKWNDIENAHPPSTLDKESRKSIRLFRKAIVRRKSIEGGVKYLIDFGKRRIIPDVVIRHGTMVEESSSERKKYWLNECYVPLHLLKSFEEKRIARKFNKMKSVKLGECNIVMKKSSKGRGFSYLFTKAERAEYYKCGHCNKDVLIREAACCQYCKGYFHKRHARKSAGSITAECIYTCHKCQEGNFVKNDRRTVKSNAKRGNANAKVEKVKSQKGKKASANPTARRSARLKKSKKKVGSRLLQSKNDNKVVTGVPLRRSPRKVKFMPVEKKNSGKRKKGKRKLKKTPRKFKKDTSWQKKRTQAYHSYWLNGLLLSRKPDDERVLQFRAKRFFSSSEHLIDKLDLPKCSLCCEVGYTSTSNYIACEICGEWFHGDAYGLSSGNLSQLVGFRCHVCRKRNPPICPHMRASTDDGSQFTEAQNNIRIECSGEVCDAVPLTSEVNMEQQSHLNEDPQGLSFVDECMRKEEQLGTIENGPLLADNKQDRGVIQISNKDFKSDLLTTSSENVTVEDNRGNSEEH